MEPLAYTIDDVTRLVGIGRTKLYEAIGSGELRALKAGRRTIIMAADLKQWLASLPSIERGAK